MEWANIALTVVLSSIALAAIIIRGVKWAVRSSLIEEGVIRPGRDPKQNWPNDYENLPQTLDGLYKAITNPNHAG